MRGNHVWRKTSEGNLGKRKTIISNFFRICSTKVGNVVGQDRRAFFSKVRDSLLDDGVNWRKGFCILGWNGNKETNQQGEHFLLNGEVRYLLFSSLFNKLVNDLGFKEIYNDEVCRFFVEEMVDDPCIINSLTFRVNVPLSLKKLQQEANMMFDLLSHYRSDLFSKEEDGLIQDP